MAGHGRENALEHVVVVVFENRSLNNVLGACTATAHYSTTAIQFPLLCPAAPGARCRSLTPV
jgi:hypothetical protein